MIVAFDNFEERASHFPISQLGAKLLFFLLNALWLENQYDRVKKEWIRQYCNRQGREMPLS
jgi:hypothetical protein